MAYVGIFYGTTFKSATTPYGATEWDMALSGGAFAYSVVGEAAFNHMVANAGIVEASKRSIMANSLKYMNLWGRSAYANAYDWSAAPDYGVGWDIGPSAAGDPDLLVDGVSVHGYRMTDRHIERFQGWIESAMLSTDLACKGVFMDDHLGGRQHWDGADRARAWGAMNGRAGYDSDAYDWNLPRLNILNARLAALQSEYPGKLVLFNSGHSASYTSPTLAANQPVMWEGYQRWYTRARVQSLCRPGDVIVLNGRFWDEAADTESWTLLAAGDQEVTLNAAMDGVSYEQIWQDALEDAAAYGLHIALGWHTRSEHATDGLDSVYSVLTDPATLE